MFLNVLSGAALVLALVYWRYAALAADGGEQSVAYVVALNTFCLGMGFLLYQLDAAAASTMVVLYQIGCALVIIRCSIYLIKHQGALLRLHAHVSLKQLLFGGR